MQLFFPVWEGTFMMREERFYGEYKEHLHGRLGGGCMDIFWNWKMTLQCC